VTTPRGGAPTSPVIVPFAPGHAAGVVALIRAVFDEYAMTFDLDGFDADLRDVPGSYAGGGGAFWVLLDGTVVGSAGIVPRDGRTCELKRLYLRPAYRGGGHGRRLIEVATGWAREHGCREIVAWSDVRLAAAHHVYRRLGFEPMGERVCADVDQSRELGFRLALA
jgi:putative acetyltransferase